MTSRIRPVVYVILALVAAGCGGSDSPTGPSSSPPPATTRIIGMSGSLSFGEVATGSTRDSTFTITNTGNAALTVSGMTVSGGLAPILTASWTSGTIAAGGSQIVNVRFAPTTAGSFSGTLSVTSDATSGGNTLAVTGTALDTFTGTFTGGHMITACNGTGSAQDLICGPTRGAFRLGSNLTFSVTLTQSGNVVTGTANLGGTIGPVTGTVNGNVVSLTGTLRDNAGFTSVITSWSTSVSGSSMSGSVGYTLTFSGLPGNAGIVASLANVTRR